MPGFSYGNMLWFGEAPIPPPPKRNWIGWNTAPLSKFKPFDLPVKKLAVCSKASAEFVAETRSMMEKLPIGMRATLEKFGVTVLPVADIFDVVEWLSYSGPRGHDGRLSWERIAGLCMFDGHLLLVGSHKWDKNRYYVKVDDTLPTFNHEAGHCLDAALEYISRSREFLECVAADIEKIEGSDRYFYSYLLQSLPAGPSEIFAECVAFHLGAHCLQLSTRSLADYFPSSCQFVAELMSRLSSTTSN